MDDDTPSYSDIVSLEFTAVNDSTYYDAESVITDLLSNNSNANDTSADDLLGIGTFFVLFFSVMCNGLFRGLVVIFLFVFY